MGDRLEQLKAKYSSETREMTDKDYIAVNSFTNSINTNPEIAELYALLDAKGLTVRTKTGMNKGWWPFGGRKRKSRGRKLHRKRRHTKKRR
jgi:hypothetical protein